MKRCDKSPEILSFHSFIETDVNPRQDSRVVTLASPYRNHALISTVEDTSLLTHSERQTCANLRENKQIWWHVSELCRDMWHTCYIGQLIHRSFISSLYVELRETKAISLFRSLPLNPNLVFFSITFVFKGFLTTEYNGSTLWQWRWIRSEWPNNYQ